MAAPGRDDDGDLVGEPDLAGRAAAGRAADQVSAIPLLVPLVEVAVAVVLSDGDEDSMGRGAVMGFSSRRLPLPLWMQVGGRSPPVCRAYELGSIFEQ
jgi:hypothetical protein